MITSKIVKTFHSAKLNSDFQLVKSTGKELNNDIVLQLNRVDGDKVTPMLEKSYLNRGHETEGILRQSYNGDTFVPTTMISRSDRRPEYFGIFHTNGDQTIGELSNGEAVFIRTLPNQEIGGISETKTTPMAERFYNKIFDLVQKEINRHSN